MKPIKVIVCITVFILSIMTIITLCNIVYFTHVISSTELLNGYKQYEYLQLELYGKTWDDDLNTISGQIRIKDNRGSDIAVIERSWAGAYLAVEFTIIRFDNKDYIFPHCVYGKNRILEGKTIKNKGTQLEKYYLDDKKCFLLGNGNSDKERHELYKIARFSNSWICNLLIEQKSNYTLDLSKCRTGIRYSIQYMPSEGFIIKEL